MDRTIPSDLRSEVMAARLAESRLGHSYVYLPEVDSTNTYLERLAREGATHGTVVVADQQTAGRGRLQRNWFSPPRANLYVSVLLRPKWEFHANPLLGLAAGIALAEAVELMLARPPTLKWPNDVLLRGLKLAGILVEAATTGRCIKHVILGFGLNVNQKEFPAELQAIATSLHIEQGRAVERGDALAAVLGRLDVWVDAMQHQPETIAARWQEFAPWLGGPVQIARKGHNLEGIALDLETTGALRVQAADGTIHSVLAGDAFPLSE